MMARKSTGKPSKNGGKTADGKFEPGNKHGKGRPEGSRNKVTLACQALLDGEAEALTKKAVKLALGGDMTALRLCLDRVIPPRRDRPVRLTLPSLDVVGGLEKASFAILAAVAAGEITPSEGQALSTILEAHRKVLELADIDRRFQVLEQKRKERTH